mmetsp:Transcript_9570/g.23845  ORF Transcript_9570/g.23845 Transcript_9570/m.23845 type:complete len:205 (-) Transcript_9570:2152-2766(-)
MHEMGTFVQMQFVNHIIVGNFRIRGRHQRIDCSLSLDDGTTGFGSRLRGRFVHGFLDLLDYPTDVQEGLCSNMGSVFVPTETFSRLVIAFSAGSKAIIGAKEGGTNPTGIRAGNVHASTGNGLIRKIANVPVLSHLYAEAPVLKDAGNGQAQGRASLKGKDTPDQAPRIPQSKAFNIVGPNHRLALGTRAQAIIVSIVDGTEIH